MTDRQINQHGPRTAEVLTWAIWRKSSYSGTQGNCVEVTTPLPGRVVVRDAKDAGGPVLKFVADEWRAFAHLLRVSGSQNNHS